MRFKSMEEMTDDEIQAILYIFYPYSKLTRAVRDTVSNYITAYFVLLNDKDGEEQRIDILPDSIYVFDETNDGMPDGTPMNPNVYGNQLYRFSQLMLAKGYSEYWMDNPYI